MKKIITASLLFGMSVFANLLFAQQITKDQMRTFQTDNVENIKKVFKKEDFNKCFQIKDKSIDLFGLSVKHERKNTFNYLLANKADVNKSCDDVTPLMAAARYGYTDMVKTLLQKGADKNAKDKNGKTAKDYAKERNQTAVLGLL